MVHALTVKFVTSSLPCCMECRHGLAMRICPSVCLSVKRVNCRCIKYSGLKYKYKYKYKYPSVKYAYKYKYSDLKYKYEYKYSSLKYEYKYKYLVCTASTYQVCIIADVRKY